MSVVRTLRVLTGVLAAAVVATLASVGPAGAARADAPAPVLSIAAPTAAVSHGDPVAITGRLTIGDVPVAGTSVQLQARPVGSDWQVVDTALTDADGGVGFTRTAEDTGDWGGPGRG